MIDNSNHRTRNFGYCSQLKDFANTHQRLKLSLRKNYINKFIDGFRYRGKQTSEINSNIISQSFSTDTDIKNINLYLKNEFKRASDNLTPEFLCLDHSKLIENIKTLLNRNSNLIEIISVTQIKFIFKYLRIILISNIYAKSCEEILICLDLLLNSDTMPLDEYFNSDYGIQELNEILDYFIGVLKIDGKTQTTIISKILNLLGSIFSLLQPEFINLKYTSELSSLLPKLLNKDSANFLELFNGIVSIMSIFNAKLSLEKEEFNQILMKILSITKCHQIRKNILQYFYEVLKEKNESNLIKYLERENYPTLISFSIEFIRSVLKSKTISESKDLFLVVFPAFMLLQTFLSYQLTQDLILEKYNINVISFLLKTLDELEEVYYRSTIFTEITNLLSLCGTSVSWFHAKLEPESESFMKILMRILNKFLVISVVELKSKQNILNFLYGIQYQYTQTNYFSNDINLELTEILAKILEKNIINNNSDCDSIIIYQIIAVLNMSLMPLIHNKKLNEIKSISDSYQLKEILSSILYSTKAGIIKKLTYNGLNYLDPAERECKTDQLL